MTHCLGNMLEHKQHHPDDIYAITTNSYLRTDKALVMGRGIAKSVRDASPGFDARAGRLIAQKCGHLGEYNVLPVQDNFVLFQVKYNFKDDADVGLISRSAKALQTLACLRPDTTFNLNFPGIGNGRLKPAAVLPLLRCLPSNVNVWEL